MVFASVSVGDSLSRNVCLCRQFLSSFISYQLVVSTGFTIGYTANVLPQLENDITFGYDEDIGSWIASTAPLFMSVGCLIAGGILDKFGRKSSHLIIAITTVIGWFLLGLAKNTTMIVIGRSICGVSAGAARTATFVYVSEITDPKYRGLSLTSSSLAMNMGILLVHLITYYVNWKISSLIIGAETLLVLTSMCFIKESPAWLLRQGNEEETVKIFRQFRGTSSRSEKELSAMIERSKLSKEKQTMSDKVKIIFSLKFLKPFAVACLISVVLQFCGINTLSYYAKDVFESTFGGTIDPFLMTMLTDTIKFLVIFLAVFLVKYIQRKTLFLIVTYATVFQLICMVLFLYFQPNNLVWLLAVVMVLYVSFTSILIAVGWSLVSEIMPADIRGLGTGLTAAVSYFMLFICVKISPGLMSQYGQVGQFSMNATVTLICIFILSFIMPKTDGKTLQEIEDNYKEKIKTNIG